MEICLVNIMKRIKTDGGKVDEKSPDDLTKHRIFTLFSLIFLAIALYSIPSDIGMTILFTTLFLLTIAYSRSRFGEVRVGELIGKEEPEEGWEQRGEEARENLRETFNRPTEPGTVSDIEHPELRKQVEDKQTEGWEIDEIDNLDESVVMIGTEGGTVGGHALTGALTGFWTFGAGNVVYDKLSKKNNRERIVLRVDENDENTPEDSDTNRDGIELLKELKELNEKGVISDEEFENKKEELLREI